MSADRLPPLLWLRTWLLYHLEYPSGWCLCHYVHAVDTLRVMLITLLGGGD